MESSPEPVPETYLDLFETAAFAYVATLLPDGSPHVTPVWVDYDGEHVLVNTVRGHRKERNVRADPRVALAVVDPENPYRYLAVRGEVVASTTDGADDHLQGLAERYTGRAGARYAGPGADEQTRVLLRIRPDHVTGQSPPAGAR